jgi:hypothetical protein
MQTTTCPLCPAQHPVREVFSQATRYEASRSLGFQSYCPARDCYFKVTAELVQTAFDTDSPYVGESASDRAFDRAYPGMPTRLVS